MSHHRSVLRDTVDQMEVEIKKRSDSLADQASAAAASAHAKESKRGALEDSSTSNNKANSPDDDVLRKQVGRFKARATAMEALVGIYRTGLIALYPDGSSYGTAQFTALERSSYGFPSGWAESEVAAVRNSFEEEIHLFESVVDELRGRLRQGASYISELRKRLEESLRANYKYELI